jgi:hypothetical protein
LVGKQALYGLIMKCPNCQEDTKYTWGVYFTHPFGRFMCSKCNTEYKHVRPWYYWPMATIYVSIVVLVPGILAYVFNLFSLGVATFFAGYWAWVVLMSVLWCFLDKFYESKLPTIKR